MKKLFSLGIFLVILGIAIFTRLFGNNWDQGQHLNPDERFLTMVATALTWPTSFTHYLETSQSPLNPHNAKFDFYVYGTWPIILVKYLAQTFDMGDYGKLTFVGRALSGICDLITLLFVFFIGKKLGGIKAGLASMLAYTLMALPIQLSHFFTTDPYLTMWLTICLYILLFPPSAITGILLGLSTGIALSAKISGILILVMIAAKGILYVLSYNKKLAVQKDMWVNIKTKCIQIFIFYSLFIVFFYLSFRLLMPYLFSDSRLITISLNEKVLSNWNVLKGFEAPEAWFPPALQWRHTQKIIYPFLSIIFVGLGIPLALLVIGSWIIAIKKLKHILHFSPGFLLIWGWILLVFGYQGIQQFLPIRYFYPIYPAIAVMVGFIGSTFLLKKITVEKSIFLILLTVLVAIWPASVLRMYSKDNPRVEASYWIYKNIPPGSSIAWEHWDDPLPLNVEPYNSSLLSGIELPIFNLEGTDKWNLIFSKLQQADYIVLSSNRAYGSMFAAKDRYPQTGRYYELLFSGQLGYKKLIEFSSRPNLPVPGLHLCIPIPYFSYGIIDTRAEGSPSCPGITFVDDYTDETWTVYDHPKVTIFQKTEGIPVLELISKVMKGTNQ